MPSQGQIEAPQPISGHAVSSAAHHHCARLEGFHALVDHLCVRAGRSEYGLEDVLVRLVGHPVLQRDVHRVVLPQLQSDVGDVAGAREVVSVLVEGDGHHAVGEVEGLLHAVAVVDVDVDVHDARKHSTEKRERSAT